MAKILYIMTCQWLIIITGLGIRDIKNIGMAFKFKNSSKEPMSEINVTPFVDVMLVLLIIFMVAAPMLTVGVDVEF